MVGVSVYARRRLTAGGAVAVLLLVLILLVRSCGSDEGSDSRAATPTTVKQPAPKQLPRGGRVLFPDWRVVALYGNPRDPELGELGIGTPTRAGIKLNAQAKPYQRKTRPVLPAMELISTIATAAPGDNGDHSEQQPDAMIARYLKAARKAKALLILDIQPGWASWESEIGHLTKWLREPDVGLALDPEWKVPEGTVPGQAIGSMHAETVNSAARYLAKLVRENDLPEKLLLVHRFTADMIVDDHLIRDHEGVQTVINVDGFGTRSAKINKYHEFARQTPQAKRGFKLFYKEDTNLLKPASVMALSPRPDVVVYE